MIICGLMAMQLNIPQSCASGPKAIMGTLIILWKRARCPLCVLFPQGGSEETLPSDKLTQPMRHIDRNLSPTRHTDGYARRTTQVPRQVLRNRPGQRSRCCCTEATIHFQSVPLPAADRRQTDKAPSCFKSGITTSMTKLFVVPSLIWKYDTAD